MSKNIQPKIELVNQVSGWLKDAKSFIIFEYAGLTDDQIVSLRFALNKSSAKLHVLKNNILRRALKEANLEGFDTLSGPNAIAIGSGDEIAPIKDVVEAAKKFGFIKTKAAFVDGRIVTGSEIDQLASIPGREGLYSMFLSCLTAPIRNFLYGLKAVAEKEQQ